MKPLFGMYSRPHLIGIGGVGMEVLARLLQAMGCSVSGTDARASEVLSGLGRDGFRVGVGHDAESLGNADLLVYSAAISADNPERQQALRSGVPSVSRAELLGLLSRQYLTLAVAGSHGKTTAASMLAAMLLEADWDPCTAIGGWRHGGAQARLGRGRYLVVEADEYQGAFLHLFPSWALITSVEAEHLDCYADLEAVERAFARFLARLPFYGWTLVAGDGAVGARVRAAAGTRACTYGFGPDNHYRAEQVEMRPWGAGFDLLRGRETLARVQLGVPGRHNVMNALGAAALALRLGVPLGAVLVALRDFAGVSRRFQKRGNVAGVLVIDDYAHHPTELDAALAAARLFGRRLVAVFQPHLYSRTQAFAADFARALSTADEVFLTPVYAARELPQAGTDADLITRELEAMNYRDFHLIQDRDTLTDELLARCQPGDLVITLGAGDIHEAATRLVQRLHERAAVA